MATIMMRGEFSELVCLDCGVLPQRFPQNPGGRLAVAGRVMNHRLASLSKKYLATLQNFVARRREADLEHAYELGREAMARKFGVLDMARIHQHALAALFPLIPEERKKSTLRAAEVFFLDSLSP